MSAKDTIRVVYQTSERAYERTITWAPGYSVADAVSASGLLDIPDIVIGKTPVGVWGEKVEWTQGVSPGDRIELYRPLIVNPKDKRLRNVSRQRQTKSTAS